MTNQEKYKTAEERIKAFNTFCIGNINIIAANVCEKCELCGTPQVSECALKWLEMETEEEKELLPCPFCGGEAEIKMSDPQIDSATKYSTGNIPRYFVECSNCKTRSSDSLTIDVLIHNWNRRVINEDSKDTRL